MTYVAFVDESEPRQDRHPGTYILSAAVMARESMDESREIMAAQKRPLQRKAHWHEASTAKARAALIDAVASTAAEHVVVVRLGDVETRSERRRRQCLERLCFELARLGVEEVVMESRGASDKLDRKLLDTLRAKRILDGILRMNHLPGPAEPLLWIPETVCGAVNFGRSGEGQFLGPIASGITMIEI